MKSIIITLITIALCTFAMCIFIFGRSPLTEKGIPYPPGSLESSSDQGADAEPSAWSTEYEITVPIVTTIIPNSAAPEIFDITAVPKPEADAPETLPHGDGTADASSDITTALKSVSKHAAASTASKEAQSSAAATASDTDNADDPDIVIEDDPSEGVSQKEQLPEIYATAEHKNWRYEIRSLDISDTLPEGITLSDTIQQFGRFDKFDDNGFLIERGDDIGDHLSQDGEYDGYLGKSYCWVTLRFDLTNLTGKDDYINVGDMNLSFGELKKVSYCGRQCYRYEHSVGVGYKNLHDYIDMIPEYMQYYTLHFEPDETKQLIFCYLIEKEYSNETFYLEMNIHNDGKSFDWLKLN